MAKEIDALRAKQAINAHREILTKLADVCGWIDSMRWAVKSSSEAYVKKEVLRILNEISIDEINRDKKGFRVKFLRDCGYNTIADIASASVKTLEAVHGISYDAALSIRRIVDEIVSNTKSSVKIRISEDNKSYEATQVVLAISKLRKSEPHIIECQRLYHSQRDLIEYAIEDLKPAANVLKWIFTSADKKKNAIDAYRVLSDLLIGQYRTDSKRHLDELYSIKAASAESAWQDFSLNSISFFNVLEDINPGILGTDDEVYGLPEELALEIQTREVSQGGLLCELRRYQEWGVKYILHQERVLLGDEMGLGKTIQAIAAMVSLQNEGATHFLVVCPASVLTNWCREIKKMSLLSVVKIHGSDKESAFELWLKSGGVAVTTYETTKSLELEENFVFSMLVVDEAHYIKNPYAQRTKSVKRIGERAERMLFMTGTALENRVDEMIALIRILKPQIASAVHGMEYLSSAPQFREAVAPVYYRRKREDVLTELPELIESREWCELSPEEEKVYEKAVLSGNFARARRVSWNVEDINNSSKANRMLEIIQEATEDGRKIIVFSFFLDTIDKVIELLGTRCFGPINGSVSPVRRQEIIDEFDKAPAGSVLAAQIQAGGTGLNIQSASVVIFCEPQFKPSIENQAVSRAYRMGQTRNVLVYRLLCEDTVDELLIDLIESKQAIFDAFADESVAAQESFEVDDKTFGNIIKNEIDRINAKYNNSSK